MRCAAARVRMAAKGRPAAHVVALEGDWHSASPVEGGHVQLTSNNDDLATVVHELAGAFASYLSGIEPDRVVIRLADWSRHSGKHAGDRLRLIAEGALTAAARSQVGDVVVKSGKDLATSTPSGSKSALDSTAASRFADLDGQAAAAALAGLAA